MTVRDAAAGRWHRRGPEARPAEEEARSRCGDRGSAPMVRRPRGRRAAVVAEAGGASSANCGGEGVEILGSTSPASSSSARVFDLETAKCWGKKKGGARVYIAPTL